MAARTNTNTDRNDAAFIAKRNELAQQFLAGSSTPRRTVTEFLTDQVADSTASFAAIAAGGAAAVQNFGVGYAAERQRQALRSADRALAAAERQLRG